ncbi:MAG: FGGY family carbohydrate kinase [Bauldia sp.]
MATAVIDIGKSNAKLALVADNGATLRILTTANAVLHDGPYPHYDVDGLWRWILAGLRDFTALADVATVSITTHGACFALLAGDALALPVLDYEHDGPESLRADYTRARGEFSETLSPDLPNGLNAGRQIYWQSRTFPTEFAKVDAILPYPQYWAWRLTGAKAAEVTSLGCHTDLWNPGARAYSRLAEREGWSELFPPLANAWDVVGTILPAVATATGLALATRVVAGIHDSNASLWPHLLARPQPFAVLSTGTWMVVFAPGGSLAGLDPERDCLANVDPLGRAVPSARFMAGREFEIVAGHDGKAASPSSDDVARVVRDGIMALPTFVPGTGPFPDGDGRWSHDAAHLSPGERAAVASLYAALMAETCLALAGAEGPVIVEGPFARNTLFLAALAQRTGRPAIGHEDSTGTIHGAAILAEGARPAHAPIKDPPATPALAIDLDAYARLWGSQLR